MILVVSHTKPLPLSIYCMLPIKNNLITMEMTSSIHQHYNFTKTKLQYIENTGFIYMVLLKVMTSLTHVKCTLVRKYEQKGNTLCSKYVMIM